MTLIIPGVEIRVIKELVPRQLGATGILGIVGHTEIDRSREALRPVSTLQEFRELFGAGSVVSMPEVAQAFANGVREVVCANVPATRGSKAGRTVSVRLADSSPGTMRVTARTSGRFGNRIATRFVRKGDGSTQLVDVEISMQDRSGALQTVETHRNLATDASAADFFVTALNQRSAYIRIEAPNEAHLTPANNNPE
ncbi:MAG: hypothetical protein PF961_15635, partial [Planctomycetota bacterium]|nr:hypothetical protein [Planctomycetota bacterium]